MSMETRTVSAVLQTSPTELVADKQHSIENILARFTAAPTVANTSVSRQTGLAGIWNNSIDPASLALSSQSGVTPKMRTNTLVVRLKNLQVAPLLGHAPVLTARSTFSHIKVGS